MSFIYYEDPILGKGRAQVDTGSGGSGGSSYVGGDRINIAGGTISFVNSADIVNVTGTSVTLQPDTAYKIYATSQAITLNANPPAAGKWAYEGHLEIFTAGTGYVVTGPNVVLANALEPDAVNNCTVRFHDGIAIISVEDHVAGYIVVNGSTSGDGSLAYGITSATQEYIAFDAILNGQTIPLAGAVAEGEKHVVGNGYTSTTLTGSVNCGTSKFTVANLALSDVQVAGGTMTLGDVYIPNGSNVAVSGGGLAIEKVTGEGSSIIDLGGRYVSTTSGTSASASGCILMGGGGANYGGGWSVRNGQLSGVSFLDCSATSMGGATDIVNGSGVLLDCVFSNCSAGYYGGALSIRDSAIVRNCTFEGNTATLGNAIYIIDSGVSRNIILDNCTFGYAQSIVQTTSVNTVLTITGTFKTDSVFTGGNGRTIIDSGTVIDLTGNSNTTPIAPGGGITFEGANQIIYGDSGATTTAYLGGGFSALTISSGGVIECKDRAELTGGTYSNVSFLAGGGYDQYCSGEITFVNANLTQKSGNSPVLYTYYTPGGVTSDVTYTISGTCNLGVFKGGDNYAGTLRFADNCVYNLNRQSYSNNPPVENVGTVIIGNNCKMRKGASGPYTYVDLTGGTYHNCTIDGNGNITEA